MPIVASNIDGFAGVLTHGVEGLLVQPEDAQALADALIDAAARRRDARERWPRAAASARSAISWDRVSQQVLSYYERLIYERRLIGSRAPSEV